MKLGKRIIVLFIIITMLFADGSVSLALSTLTMPSELQIIDVEAFYGNTSIDKVTLPEGVLEIRARAFANSTLSEINLPDSIMFIADDAFDSPDKVTVTASIGTYAYSWAEQNGYLGERIEATGFSFSTNALTLTTGSTYTINTSLVPSDATSSITWDSSQKTVATVSDGTVFAKAEGDTVITAVTDNGLSATCEVNVVHSIDAPVISSAEQDGIGKVTLVWNSLGEEYEYIVYELINDSLNLLGSTRHTTYTTSVDSEGIHSYCVQALIYNDEGVYICSDESVPYDVDVQFIWSFGATIDRIEQISQDTVDIAWRGVSPVSYYEIAEVIGKNYIIIADNLTGDTTTISALTQGVHRFAIRSLYHDQNSITWISSWSTLKAVEMVDVTTLQPAAPELIFANPAFAFSISESEAPEYETQRFEISWGSVENAIEYGVRLSYKQGTNWIDIIDDTTKENRYSINESIFDELIEMTSYRLMLTSIGKTESSPNAYYFCICPPQINTDLLINGVSSNTIYHTSAKGKTYNFDIESQYSVTVNNNSSWIIAECSDNSLSISIDDDNSTFVQERNAVVTLSNGYSEAIINVYQWNVDEAPYLDNYSFSTLPENPTDIPYGDISLRICKSYGGTSDGCAIIAELYQQSNSGEWVLISQLVKSEVISTTWDIAFEDSGIEIGNTLKLRIVECGLAEYNSGLPQYRSDLINEYYFRMVGSGHSITVNGQNNVEISSADAVTVSVAANSTWSYSTQCDWITIKSKKSNVPNCANLTITPTKNDTDNSRTATISLICGSATSNITFTQLSTKPLVILPVLSTDESSPTTLTAGDNNSSFAEFVFRNLASATFEYKSGTTYVEDSNLGIYISTSKRSYTYYEAYDWSQFTTGVVYQLTVSNGETDAVYYFRVQSGSTYALIKGENDTSFTDVDYYNASSEGKVLTYTLKSSASWIATTDVSWLHLSKTSGSKNTTGIPITLTIDPNDTNAVRHGIASFRISNTDRCFIRVEQNPSSEYLTLYQCTSSGTITSSELDFSSVEGSTGEFYLLARTNAVRLSYSSDVSWMKATDANYNNIKVSITAANTDSDSRTGHITITAGTSSRTITVTQVPDIDRVNLLSPHLENTSKTEPGVVQYGNMNITWEKTAQAVRYGVRIITPEDEDIYYDVVDNGNNTYSLNIPIKKIGLLQDGLYQLRIYAYNAWDYYSNITQYFRFVQGDSIFIGGETAPIWNNVTEFCITSEPYSIMSTGVWTAQSNSSWITLSQTTGTSGDSFTVTLTQNTGSARSGRITVSCGNATGYLTINQCAPIPEFPSLTLPNYSTDKSNPTIIPAGTTSITAIWINEPQASQYEIDLLEYSAKSAGHYVAKSGALRNGEEQYTFKNLSLAKGQLYWVTIKRTNNRKTTGTSYYFMLDDENSFVTLNGETITNYDDDARGGGTYYSVNSSGVWNAISDSNWLTVGKKYVDEDYLAKTGEDAEDYLEHYGQSGDTLYVYMFPNTTNSSRVGTVTVKSGTASATITFTQEKQYKVASLISPVLAENSSEAAEIGYGSLTLNWSASSSGTGNYEVLLYESDSRNSGYSRIYRKQNITARSLTIPESTFTEGNYYRLWLGSEIEDGDDYENGHNYYFIMGYQNGLSVSADVDWNQVDNGGYINITAFASGGTGDYYYAYQLLLDGIIEQQTTWETLKYYQFKPWSNGNYQVKVIVKDSTNKQVTYTSEYTKDDENTISVATANHYSASLDSNYQFIEYSVLSQRSWFVTSYPDWITPSTTGVSFSDDIRLIVEKNDGMARVGEVVFLSDTGIESDLKITQNGSGSIALESNEGSYTSEAQSIRIALTAVDTWTVASNSVWAAIESKSGESGNNTIIVNIDENDEEEERTAIISVICNGDICEYVIHQDIPVIQVPVLYAAGTTYSELQGNQTFRQPTDINCNMTISGNLTIKAHTTIDNNCMLTVDGNVIVKSGGILDLRNGGSLKVKGNFEFNPSTSHSSYLTAGDIYVGGNVEIKNNFFASGTNRFHLTSEQSKHTINMWNQWFSSDQYFNYFIVDSQGLDALDIKETFSCNQEHGFIVNDWSALKQTSYGEVFSFSPNYLYGNKTASAEIISRAQYGLLRALYNRATYNVISGFDIKAFKDEFNYPYMNSKGDITYFSLAVNYVGIQMNGNAGVGTVTYKGTEGTYSWIIASTPAQIDSAISEFGTAMKKYVIQTAVDEMVGSYKNAVKSCILELMPSDKTNAFKMTQFLKKYKNAIEGYYKLLK